MPRLKKRNGPYDRLLFLLRGYEIGPEELAHALGCSRGTAYNRFKNPGSFTLAELRQVNRAGVPIEELRGVI